MFVPLLINFGTFVTQLASASGRKGWGSLGINRACVAREKAARREEFVDRILL